MKLSIGIAIGLVTGTISVIGAVALAAIAPINDLLGEIPRWVAGPGEILALVVAYAVPWAGCAIWASKASSGALALSRASSTVALAASVTILAGLAMWQTQPSSTDRNFAEFYFEIMMIVFTPIFLLAVGICLIGWWIGHDQRELVNGGAIMDRVGGGER